MSSTLAPHDGRKRMPDVPTSDPEQFYQGAPLLLVPDVSATADFYVSILGFRADTGANTTEYSVVWRDNAAVHLAKGEHAPTGVRIFFWVKDVNTLYEQVTKRGAIVAVPIGTRPYGVRDFSIRDPNGVEIVCGQDSD
ncbi:MAG TPA: glyoxalase superfamily protein [Vicinamibacterales bacterium]|nr:glyoxalase superfamily protein [Vicinamibacterales bacterium]